MALGVSLDEVVARNVKKLEKRYPGGQFDVYYSENREVGDL
jgi:predicted nucleotidyltransferase